MKCPPGCKTYTPEQGCTYHGTLPERCCEPHLVIDCPDCGQAPQRPPIRTSSKKRLILRLLGQPETRPRTVHDVGFGGSDITYEQENAPVCLGTDEWDQVQETLCDAGLTDLARDISEQWVKFVKEA